jgi:hypothetical protein
MSYGKIVTQVSRLGKEISRYTIRTTCEREIKSVDNAYKEYFAAMSIIIVDWPVRLPDLNPIETLGSFKSCNLDIHIWNML